MLSSDGEEGIGGIFQFRGAFLEGSNVRSQQLYRFGQSFDSFIDCHDFIVTLFAYRNKSASGARMSARAEPSRCAHS